jgi:uncharacterized delta-60 repeat protein
LAFAGTATAATSEQNIFAALFGAPELFVTAPLAGDGGANAVAPVAGGFILTGQTNWSGSSAFELAQFRNDGTPDPTFGENGRVRIHIGGSALAAHTLVRPDGSLIVTGGAYKNGRAQIAVARLRPDGTLDERFGDDGIFLAPVGVASGGMATVPGGAGTLVVGGTAQVGPTAGLRDLAFVAVRIKLDGTPDPSFGQNGVAIGPRPGHAYAITMQPDGKLVWGGESLIGERRVFAAARLTPQGRLDTTFGTNGFTTVPIGTGAFATGIVLAPNGTLTLGGNAFTNTAVTATARLTRTGRLDPTYGNAGVATAFTKIGVNGLVRLADGRMLVPGTGGLNVARLKADGSLDQTFAGDGVAEMPVGDRAAANGAAIDPFGRILLGGAVFDDGVGHLAGVRLPPDG